MRSASLIGWINARLNYSPKIKTAIPIAGIREINDLFIAAISRNTVYTKAKQDITVQATEVSY